MKQNKMKGAGFLSAAALIWGTAFVAQSVGLQYIGTFTYTTIRSVLGALVLLPLLLARHRAQAPEGLQGGRTREKDSKKTLLGGLACGTALCVAANLQQIGISLSTVGKSGFITALYIVLVPLLGLVIGKKVKARVWLAVGLAVLGLYFLCMNEKLALQRGDIYLLLCAVAFGIQIQAVDHCVAFIDGILLSCMEFAVCAIFSAIPMLLLEHPPLASVWQARWSLLYTGFLSSGVAYTFQILGQKELEPSLAALIMSFESVISALAGWLLLGQVLSGREILGCAIMFGAILLAQTG